MSISDEFVSIRSLHETLEGNNKIWRNEIHNTNWEIGKFEEPSHFL